MEENVIVVTLLGKEVLRHLRLIARCSVMGRLGSFVGRGIDWMFISVVGM